MKMEKGKLDGEWEGRRQGTTGTGGGTGKRGRNYLCYLFQGFHFAAAQHEVSGDLCRCGQSYDNSDPSVMCNTKCTKDNKELCGGLRDVMIAHTG